MARICSVCSHPDRAAIERALIAATSPKRTIAGQYGLSHTALLRHESRHLAPELAKIAASGALAAARYAPAGKRTTNGPGGPNGPNGPGAATPSAPGKLAPTISAPSQLAPEVIDAAVEYGANERARLLDLRAEVARILERTHKLFDACDRWLTDPESPDRYSIDARAAEIQVVYEDWQDRTEAGAPKRKRGTLAELLERIEASGQATIVRAETRYADPRKLILETEAAIRGRLQLLATLAEKLAGANAVQEFERAVLDAIGAASPETRAAIEAEMRRRNPAHQLAL